MNSIKEHPTWHIIDSSSLQTYMRCPRKTFFSKILGWQSETPSVHLVAGEAWHRGMEYILLSKYDEDAIKSAHILFTEYYRRYFSEIMDSTNEPKTPGVARIAFETYVKQYKQSDIIHDVLHTEVAGSVRVGEFKDGRDKLIHFRLDSIVRNNDIGKIESWEHKTGSRNSGPWRDQWIQKLQVGTYTHVLNCAYNPDDVYGVRINGTFFYKSQDPAHVRVPVRRSPDQMQEWLWTVNTLIDDYYRDLDRLSKCSPSDRTMKAFPKRTEACTDYGICPFFDRCIADQNPLRNFEEPPPGFKVEFWDPRVREEDASNIYKDNKIEVKK